MIKFIFFFLIFGVLLVLLMGFSVLRTLKNAIFGSSEPKRSTSSRQQQRQTTQKKPPRKKIFTKDDGEYVDYEEVK
ncbi:hypothetical protein FACS189415_2720 [Bacteroidia bacterium]|nr:hypothetical protein AGMMS49574_29580 [Bacteroidia bacterium]GHU82382.1 hypothetical protein FACS189415_2720 [Bacteroidia bacterium]GHV06476.1 hypothetical protein FACS189416_7090 [Bacteroidia bacterium]